jgi:hypothetical protein
MSLPQARETPNCHRHHAVSLLFANDPQLLHFFFTPDRLALRFGDHRATRRLADDELDVQESILVHLALDLWLEKGHGLVHQTYRYLSPQRLQGLTMALELLAAAGGCRCQNCSQRLSPELSAWVPFPQTF